MAQGKTKHAPEPSPPPSGRKAGGGLPSEVLTSPCTPPSFTESQLWGTLASRQPSRRSVCLP
ncbi:hypothetical protein BU23DRAFT_552916 [Bimuria novae-zelandiae CBS 107.79]|uniref:Uncharacterized protein n=1 Tax=Bimuria novae-zelandiae CBS 107.79 TaxID=1447943 RepID=A0A6A5VGT1_9PLEO|nr:hypothetical protein BU23DRAFT_552916 [Bimuria novae-zelandiae CBS 107.79]